MKRLIVTVRANAITAGEKATLSFEQLVRNWRAAGISDLEIRKRLMADFISPDPRFFGEFKTEIRDLVAAAQVQAYQHGVMDEYSETDTPMRWTLENDVEHCDDCLRRAGEVKPARVWALIGLPGSGFSRCGANCRCSITPEDVNAPDVLVGGIGAE